jgi:hypothetical protein
MPHGTIDALSASVDGRNRGTSTQSADDRKMNSYVMMIIRHRADRTGGKPLAPSTGVPVTVVTLNAASVREPAKQHGSWSRIPRQWFAVDRRVPRFKPPNEAPVAIDDRPGNWDAAQGVLQATRARPISAIWLDRLYSEFW